MLLAVGFLLLGRRALRRRRENAILHAAEPAVAARLASLFGATAEAAEVEPASAPIPMMVESAAVPVMAESAPVPVMAESAPVPVVPEPEPLPVIAEAGPTPVLAEATTTPAVADAAAAPPLDVLEDAGPGPAAAGPELAVVPFASSMPAAAPVTPEPPAPPAPAEPPTVVPPPITVFVPPAPVEPVAALPAAAAAAPTAYGSASLRAHRVWDGGGTVDPGYAAAAAAAAETIRRQRRRQTASVWMPSVRPGRLLRMPEDPRRRMGRDASAVLLVIAVAGLLLFGANVLQPPGGNAPSGTPRGPAAVGGGPATPDVSPSDDADATSVAFATVTPIPTPTQVPATPARTPPVTGRTPVPATPTPRPATPRPTPTAAPAPLVAGFDCDRWTVPADAPVTCTSMVAGTSYRWFVGPDLASLVQVGTGPALTYTFPSTYTGDLGYIRLVVTRGPESATKDGAVSVQ